MTRGIYLNLMRVFEISREAKVPTYVAADRMAEERIATIRKLGSRHWGRFISNHKPEAG
jgi:leucine dehydrogenase